MKTHYLQDENYPEKLKHRFDGPVFLPFSEDPPTSTVKPVITLYTQNAHVLNSAADLIYILN